PVGRSGEAGPGASPGATGVLGHTGAGVLPGRRVAGGDRRGGKSGGTEGGRRGRGVAAAGDGESEAGRAGAGPRVVRPVRALAGEEPDDGRALPPPQGSRGRAGATRTGAARQRKLSRPGPRLLTSSGPPAAWYKGVVSYPGDSRGTATQRS